MKIVSLVVASVLSAVNHQPAPSGAWTFVDSRSAVLTEPDMTEAPLRLACSDRGFLEITILATAAKDVTLVTPAKIMLTIQGKPNATGRIVTHIYFRSMTAEFLRQEGDVEVTGAKPYRLHLTGAKQVLQTLESSCMMAS